MSPSSTGALTLRGIIRTIYFAGPRFSAGRIETPEGATHSFAGKGFARVGELVTLEGEWRDHPKYGRQFDAHSIALDLDLDRGGLSIYLANHPEMKGIGPARAKLIADRFGDDFARWLDEAPESIAAIAKVPLDTILNLRKEWEKTRAVNDALVHLSAFDLTHHQVTTLVEKFGSSVISLLDENPYLLVREIRGMGFRRVDRLARMVGTPKNHPGRIRAGLLATIEETLDEGDCWIESEDLIARANALLVMDELDSRERIESILDQLIEEGAISCKSQGGRFLISDPEIREQEEDLAEILRSGRSPSVHFKAGPTLDAEISRTCPSLNEGQRDALRRSLTSSISVISGGAGCGKTFTISSIVEFCGARGLRVLQTAPTGKAAKRMEQVVGQPAHTVHRVLGFDGKTFHRGPESPIDADVLIVDEVSMVDVPLAWHLFRTIDLARTAVILVGDHNQLPPVGPGDLLRDLIETRAVPVTILETVVRQAGILKENSIAVLRGEIRKTSDRASTGRRAWYVADQFTEPTSAQKFLLDLYEKVLTERLGFDLVQDIQLLTPTYKGPLGASALNVEIQRLVQRKLYDVAAPELLPNRRPKLLENDKVIQTRNNYETGVMNGSIGRVTRADRSGAMAIDFDGVIVEIEPGSPHLKHIQLAYALTIHKAQGSEFPCAIVVVHKAHSFMHHRNLLYTGVTRARETAILVGDRWGMQNCAGRRVATERRTFLSHLLAEGVNAESVA